VGLQTPGFDPEAGRFRLFMAELRQANVAPAGEEVLQVPFALTVADEDQGSGHDVSLRLDKSSGDAEYIQHGVKARLSVARPERRLDGAAGENGPVLRLMREGDAFAAAGEDNRMIAYHRPASQRGKADGSFLARARVTIPHADAASIQVHAAPLRRSLA